MPRRETARAIRRAAEDRRRRHRLLTLELPCVIGGALLMLAALPLPWVFGGSGLDYAFGAGTAWPLRAPGLASTALIAGAALYGWRRRGAELLMLLVAVALGGHAAFVMYWDSAALGSGFWLSAVGGVFVGVGAWVPARARTGELSAGAVGGAIAAYQLVGPQDIVYLLAGGALLAAGLYSAARREWRARPATA